MLQNLSKFNEIQKQADKQAEEESKNLGNALEMVANQQIIKVQKPIQPKDVQVYYSISFDFTYEKIESQEMEIQRKRFLEAINSITKYNNPMFIQYLGIQVREEKPQVKKVQQPKTNKKQNDKKNEKSIEVTKKQPLKIENQTKDKQNGKDKKQEQNASLIVQPKIKLRILTQENIQKFDLSKYKKQIKSKAQFSERLSLACDLIEAMANLHELQYTVYPSNIEDLLVVKQNHLKLAIHTTAIWRMIKQEQIAQTKTKQSNKFKKQSMINPSLRYTSPEFIIKTINIKDVRLNDIWKTGVIILTLLIGEDLSKDLLALESLDQAKMKEFRLIEEAKVTKMKKYLRADDITEIMKMLSLNPVERPPLKTFKEIFRKIKQEQNECINIEALMSAKEQYQKERLSKVFKLMPQLKANEELLTLEHRKKLSQYFKINQNRSVRDFKLNYRASQTKFSCKSFYQVAYDKKGILIIICEKTNHKKLIVYSQEAFDLSKCNGVFGGYIKDTKKLSFIYSPQQNQFCKLKNAERAIGVSYIQGPIIGDGDLVISDGGLYNLCRFPVSYESLKLKRLMKAQKFELLEYDVYQVLF